MKIQNYTNNPDLHTILNPQRWKGNPLDSDGLFMNHEYPFQPNFRDFWKWQREGNPEKKIKKQDKFRLPVAINDTEFLNTKEDVIVWLGHATFFIRFNGVSLITDPIFGSSLGLKRLAPMPFDENKLTNIDYVLLSHDHRDHLDEKSLKKLHKNNPDMQILTGLKMEEWLRKMLKAPNYQSAGWYQQYKTDTTKIKIYFMPARHWSRRGLRDTNRHLWGAFVLESAGKRLFFSGDTGYGNHLKEISDLFGAIDVCILGVGAFKPEWFMGANHISPYDAVKAVNEMEVQKFIPMHYGTFDLSNEPVGEPQEILEKLDKEGKIKPDLHILTLGKVLKF